MKVTKINDSYHKLREKSLIYPIIITSSQDNHFLKDYFAENDPTTLSASDKHYSYRSSV